MSTTTTSISDIVSAELVGATEQYLRDIVNHGIHNLTNDFHGSDDDEYEAYADEFTAQASALLNQ